MAGVRLEFSQRGYFDYFNIYRYSTTTEIDDLPPAIATTTTMFYVDAHVVEGVEYIYRIGVVRGGVEAFSNEMSIIAIAQNIIIGGSESEITIDNIRYKTHTFTSDGTLEIISVSIPIDILVVGGGGSGAVFGGGGGGGGGVAFAQDYIPLIGNYSIIVGSGGAEKKSNGNGNAGSDSKIINENNVAILQATGGEGGYSGSGGQRGGNSGAGYIDGVEIYPSNKGAGSNSSGIYNGGAGAGSVAGGGGAGGIGLAVSIMSNTPYRYGGGGGSGIRTGSSPTLGGLDGGGNGRSSENGTPSTAGQPNSGGGGGGAWGVYSGANGGGSGIIIIRYRN